ncbi:MAG: DMT family transporter [Alphaproteobacteria bacterium]
MTGAAPRPWMASAAPVAFIVLWSSAFIGARAGLPHVSPLLFLGARFVLAALLLAAICLVWKQDWSGMGRRWPHFVVAGILINGLYLSGAFVAMTHITGATMALVGSLHPLLTALLSGLVLGDRFRPSQWLGFACGVGGVALVAGVRVGDFAQMEGMALGTAATVALVLGTLYYSKHCKGAPLIASNTVQLAGAAAVTLALMAAFETPHAEWTPEVLAALIYLAVIVSVGGMALFLFMLKTGTAGKVAANFYLTPGVTAVIGWLVLGEGLSAAAIAGFALASAGVWLVNRSGRTETA